MFTTNLTGFIFIRARSDFPMLPNVTDFTDVTAKSGRDFVTRKTSSKTSPSVWESIARDVRQAQRASPVRHFTAERLNLLNFECACSIFVFTTLVRPDISRWTVVFEEWICLMFFVSRV